MLTETHIDPIFDDLAKVKELQSIIYELSPENYSLTKNYILSNNFLSNRQMITQLISSLSEFSLNRRNTVDLVVNLFSDFSTNIKKYLTESDILNLMPLIKFKYLVYRLLEINFVSIESIIPFALHDMTAFGYFSPEIKAYDLDLFNKYRERSKRTRKTVDKFDTIHHISYRKSGSNQDPISVSIVHDDLESFLDIISHTEINLNSKIEISPYEIFQFFWKPTMIDYAAYYGSLQIYKYLLMNKVGVTWFTKVYAAAGGNYEIVHLCEENGELPERLIGMAIQFHRNEIVEYILNQQSYALTVECIENSLYNCIYHYNVKYFEYFLTNHISDIRDKAKMIQAACYYGRLDFLKCFHMLLDLQDYKNHSFLHEGAYSGHTDVVKFLLSLGYNINQLNHVC
ncbi:hypothetical protein TRFO_33830 [Tritrichomonas foetus]|uniref:DUF3447 domain-containing protein n=1 Tax=Tritrichomonas foetus TaxID=1144522 RepID=A0A1J4JLY7_9EUKA|nr:hypothetical protein TRFO_33830 [Tritrichomonas foetus]|eukprot:OHS99705.1 hypothetical protein TRFO_33830 [Tritrichomonas foetus]